MLAHFPLSFCGTCSLAYLSSQQALADLARLLAYVKTSYKTETSQIITVGGSYSGNLAAWFSVKYPAMTDGSVASSGPILAETNFTEYMDVVADSLEFFEGNTCVYYLQLAAEAVASLANEGVGSAGYTQLDTDFATCSPMASENDLSILLSDLMGYVQGTVQYNKAKPGSFNITTVCDVMLDVDGDRTPYDQFVTLAGMYRADYGLTCEDASWEDTVDYLAATQNDGDNSGRPWTYQTCNEFGYFQTTDSTVCMTIVFFVRVLIDLKLFFSTYCLIRLNPLKVGHGLDFSSIAICALQHLMDGHLYRRYLLYIVKFYIVMMHCCSDVDIIMYVYLSG